MHSTDPHVYYQALKSRDPRFDGLFFVGVTSTGIYCRPICRVKTPQAKNCRFFTLACQAENGGFRPCLRCRPELAPQAPHAFQAFQTFPTFSAPQHWSSEDASHTLALQAAQMLQQAIHQQPNITMTDLAAKLGISERHLRRIFQKHLGVAPLQFLQTQRLLAAKTLLTDTRLPITEVAASSGFGSLRGFNAAFLWHYGLAPTQLRKPSQPADARHTGHEAFITLELGFRPPYNAQALLSFWQARQVDAIESIAIGADLLPAIGQKGFQNASANPVESSCVSGVFTRSLQIMHAGQLLQGWLQAAPDLEKNVLRVRLSDRLAPALPAITARLRAAFDLDADPIAIEDVLGAHFNGAAGMRVPGSLDGFEITVRAILGQQVTVAAARTFTQRLVNAFGSPIQTPWPQINRCFPTPAQLAQALPEQLGALGIVRQRQTALIELSRGVAEGTIVLDASAPAQQTLEQLKTLPGIGDWTAQYIAMRALRWPDAFPAGDIALHHALGVRHESSPTQRARLAELASQAWRPWRSYAVLRVWEGLLRQQL